jgi:hypothetical protein
MDSPLLIHPSTTIEIQEKPEIAAIATATKPETSPPFLIGQILVRIAVVFAIAAACIFANHATSNSFEISVVNAAANTAIGRRFHVMFVANGKISQILYSSNKIIEQVLYPNGSFPKKPINHITIHLSGQNLTDMVAVRTGLKPGEFSVILGHGFLSSENPVIAFRTVLNRAMARVRAWDGPEEVVSAMVEYLAMQATSETFGIIDARLDGSCWSPGFLRYCESREHGFVARLNRQLRDRYAGLGLLKQSMCQAYKATLIT